MNEPTITIAGNLVDDPQLRFTTSGQAVALLRIASTPRRRDRVGQWSDGNTTFLDAEAWGTPATNAAECLAKGDRVVVTGRIRTDVYTPDEGPNAGTEVRRLRIVADEVAVSLRHATARPVRAQRSTEVEDAEAS
jgi:single-strand DNA-binding protein